MKKRSFAALLLALCLTGASALAEPLAARVDAPGRATLPAASSPSGRTTVTIDAEVVVPDVEKAPLVRVEIGAITDQQALAAAEMMRMGSAALQKAKWETYVQDDAEGESRSETFIVQQSDFYRCYLFLSYLPNGALEESTLDFSDVRTAQYTLCSGSQTKPYPAEREGTLTRGEALEKAQVMVEAVAPGEGYRLYSDGALDGYVPEWALTGEQRRALASGKGEDPSVVPKVPYAYCFQFTRDVEGIPIACVDTYQPMWSLLEIWEDDPNAPEIYRKSRAVSELLEIAVVDTGICALRWSAPSEVKERVAEDCELLPFADILERGRQELVSRYAFGEGSGEKINVNVWSIRLGYERVLEEDGRLLLTPVWDFFVSERHEWAGQDNVYVKDGLNVVGVTLSAIDGSPLPRDTYTR